MLADTCVYIDVIGYREGWRTGLKILTAAEDGRIDLVASTLLLAEIAGVPLDRRLHDRRDDIVSQYLQGSLPVVWVELDLVAARRVQQLTRRYPGLRGADATHLAAAERAHCDYLMTGDGSFRRAVGASHEDVKLTSPDVRWQGSLVDEAIDQMPEPS